VTHVWVDANVILRYLLKDSEKLFSKSREIMLRAEQGQISLHVSVITCAEVVWALESLHGYSPSEIAGVLTDFLAARGVVPEDRGLLFATLDEYRSKKVDFADAILAAKASKTGWAVCTFDKHFKRLAAPLCSPELKEC